MEVCTFPLCTSYDMPMILVDKKIRFWLYDCILKNNFKKNFFYNIWNKCHDGIQYL